MGSAGHDLNSNTAAGEAQEVERTRRLAERYRCPFIDLREQRIDPDLFRAIPAELMFRYSFVPLESHNNSLVVAVSDPSQLLLTDELALLLGKKLVVKVATSSQIGELLKRTEQSQRVLEQATEGFALQVVSEEEGDETISADRITRDTAVNPVVRLVDTVIFTALERRASDIHIESRAADGGLAGRALCRGTEDAPTLTLPQRSMRVIQAGRTESSSAW